MVATSANKLEAERAQRAGISADLSTVHVRGTKRKTRDRVVPIVLPICKSVLAYSLRHIQGVNGLMFLPWQNMHRDIWAACDRANIPRCSSNDLRRTHSYWLKAAGASDGEIAPVMGHSDTTMVEKVYGKLNLEDLRHRLARSIGLPVECDTVVSAFSDSDAVAGQNGQSRASNLSERRVFGASGWHFYRSSPYVNASSCQFLAARECFASKITSSLGIESIERALADAYGAFSRADQHLGRCGISLGGRNSEAGYGDGYNSPKREEGPVAMSTQNSKMQRASTGGVPRP
jgi:integrase-like protein